MKNKFWIISAWIWFILVFLRLLSADIALNYNLRNLESQLTELNACLKMHIAAEINKQPPVEEKNVPKEEPNSLVY